MAVSANNEGLPNFLSPPINEVVCGVFFHPLKDFLLVHYGDFWNSIKTDFPNLKHAPNLGPFAFSNSQEAPLPRIWMISENNHNLVQLQNNCFFYNWRDTSETPEDYPRFSNVFERYKNLYEKYILYVEANNLGSIQPHEYELTYINHIPRLGQLKDAKLSEIFPDFAWRQGNRYLPAPQNYNLQLSIEYPEESSRLSIQLQTGILGNGSVPVYILTLSVRGIPQDNSLESMVNWFTVARSRIVKGFVDLTSEDIRSDIWQQKV